MSMRSIYRKIAREHNVSVEEVKREMQAAVDFAYQNVRDDSAAERQRQVRRKGEIPTAEEFILFASEEINKERKRE